MDPFTHEFDIGGARVVLSFYEGRGDSDVPVPYYDVTINGRTGRIRQPVPMHGGWNRYDIERGIRQEFESGELQIPGPPVPELSGPCIGEVPVPAGFSIVRFAKRLLGTYAGNDI